jgi:hypothetical protein
MTLTLVATDSYADHRCWCHANRINPYIVHYVGNAEQLSQYQVEEVDTLVIVGWITDDAFRGAVFQFAHAFAAHKARKSMGDYAT